RVGAGGAGLHFLLEPTSSPLIGALLTRLRELYPNAGIHFYAPLTSDNGNTAAATLFGQQLQPVYDFTRADVVLSLDADFLAGMPYHLRYAHDFAERRRIRGPSDSMNRLYLVETAFSPTGSLADHRLRARPSLIPAIALSVLSELGLTHGVWASGMPDELRSRLERAPDAGVHGRWISAVAGDLVLHRGRSVVIAGERQPPIVHIVAHLLNSALGNRGATVRYIECPLLHAGENGSSLNSLVDAVNAGQVETLAILEGNPSYTASPDLEFSRRLRQVTDTIYLGLYQNETAVDAKAFLPALHYLEAWGDARAYDGTASLVQPLISPLYGGGTPADVLAAFLGDRNAGAHDLLRQEWKRTSGARGIEQFWDQALQRGVLPDTAAPAMNSALRWEIVGKELASSAEQRPASELELVVLPDPKVYDGSFADNAWLQELPDPITKLTWDNAAMLSPATAAKLGAGTGDMIHLRVQGRELRIPALVVPGHADDSISLHLGYGRRADAEPVARGVGFDGYMLWGGNRAFLLSGVQAGLVRENGSPVRHPLATTQTHWAMEGRPLVLEATLEEYRQHPEFTKRESGRALSLYQPQRYTGNQWAMVIDQSLCTGCGGCVVACQA
ncbi:MAG TPA: hypothetical protein VHK68_10745, partial [Gemmatimonadales bacterium]|nr:hypothetical protein [Gemmatimonadales bacterium]